MLPRTGGDSAIEQSSIRLGPARTFAPLLERDRELTEIGDAVQAGVAGSGRLLIVEGEAGIGKSRLLAAAAVTAEEAGAAVVRARGHELEQSFAWGIALQLFQARLAHAEPHARERLLAGAARLALPVVETAVAPDSEVETFSQLHGLNWLTANMAVEAPLAIVIDDAHWADERSLQFVLYLAQRLSDLAVSAVVSFRPEEAFRSHSLQRLVAHQDTRVLILAPLSEGGVGDLIRSAYFPRADAAFVEACFDASRGNPFLLTSLLEDRKEACSADGPVELVGDAVPATVLRSALLRLGRLGEESVEVARAVAVLGREATATRAAALAGLDKSRANEAIATLQRARILADDRAPVFVHPLVESSVYGDLPAATRSRMHAEAAFLLLAERTHPGVAALHFLRADATGSEAVVDVLAAAARIELARGAADTAARFLRRALAEPPPPEVRQDLLVALAEAEARVGDPRAAERLQEAAGLIVDNDKRAEAMARMARLKYVKGDLEGAASVYAAALAELDHSTSDLNREIEAAYVAVARMVPARAADASKRAETAVRTMGAAPGPAQRALLGHAAMARMLGGGTSDEAVALARRALDDGRLLRDEGPDSESFYVAVGVMVIADRLDEAVAILDRALDLARRSGSVMAFATASACRAYPLLMQGRVAESVADVEVAMEARRYGWEQFMPSATSTLALGLLELDDVEAAAKVFEPLAEERERWLGMPWAAMLTGRGRVKLSSGNPRGALEDLLEAGRLWVESHAPGMSFYHWRGDAALAAAQLGDHALAAQLAREELEITRTWGSARHIGAALRVAGLVARQEGLPMLRESVQVLEGSPSHLDHLRALVDLGAGLRRAGERVEAREVLNRTIGLADSLGAVALSNRGADELRAAGGRPVQRALAGVGALTPSELRVARMAADGMTNREIAQALFVTVKAIEWHLHNAYPKLGVGSRRELPAALGAPP